MDLLPACFTVIAADRALEEFVLGGHRPHVMPVQTAVPDAGKGGLRWLATRQRITGGAEGTSLMVSS